MKLSQLSRNQLQLLIEMFEKKKVTSATQKTFWRYAFYMNIASLRDIGLVQEDGVNENNQKVWVLSEKGHKVAGFLKQIEEVM